MNYQLPFLDYIDSILSHPATIKLIVIIGTLILFRIYSSNQGAFGMDQTESKNFFSFLLFYLAFVFMLRSERSRPTTQEYHVFSEFLYVIVVTGLFSVLHLDKMFPILTAFIESITKLMLARKGNASTKDEITNINAEITKRTTEIPTTKEEEPR